MPARPLLIAAAVTAAALAPTALAARADAAPRDDLPAIVKMSIAEIDYVLNQEAPVTVKVAPPPKPKAAKPATLKLYVDTGILPAELVQKIKLGKVKKTVTKTVKVKLKRTGPFRVKACIGLICTTSPLRTVDGTAVNTAATPGTYHLAIRGGYLKAATEGKRMTGDTYCTSEGFSEHGIEHMNVSFAGESPATAENVLTINPDGTVQGRVVWQTDATYGWDSLDGCVPNPAPQGPRVIACNGKTHHDVGTQDLGFTFESAPGNPGQVTLHWHLPNPDAGFFDADDSVCNVQTIAQYLTDADETTTVPLSDFMDTAAGSVAFGAQDSATFDKDYQDKPASITESWDEGIRVARVP